MEIQVNFNGEGHALIEVSGRLDVTNSPLLEQSAEECVAKTAHIVMDIAGVEYISSAGLRVLLTVHKKCAQQNGRFVVINPNEFARELFEMTGFADVLNLE